MPRKLKPGTVAPVSAQYEIVGPRGGKTGVERTVTKGERLPPPLNPGETYRIADRTKNKSGHN
jgi:hypothetical protein